MQPGPDPGAGVGGGLIVHGVEERGLQGRREDLGERGWRLGGGVWVRAGLGAVLGRKRVDRGL